MQGTKSPMNTDLGLSLPAGSRREDLCVWSPRRGETHEETKRRCDEDSARQDRRTRHWQCCAQRTRLGSLAIGSAAIGALALGALAVGRLKVGRASLKEVTVGRLKVDELIIGDRILTVDDLSSAS